MSMPELLSLGGKTAVVIGGGGVLAGEMAGGFAGAGASVAVVDRDLQQAEARAAAIRSAGGQAIALAADVTRRCDLEAALDAIVAQFGGADILLNAAGINSGTPFFDITEEEWRRILDVDLTG